MTTPPPSNRAESILFGPLLNVPKRTATSWETGARKPSGAALELLQLVRQTPDLLISA